MRNTERPLPTAEPPVQETRGPAPHDTGRWPAVSVVVPTRNRGAQVASLLEALLAQIYPTDRLEVIVVDNSSADDTEAVVQRAAARAPFPVRYFRKEDRGPAPARNLGASHASGDILAFTDSDCLPAPFWLRHAVTRFEDGVGLVCGPITPVDGAAPPTFLMHQIHDVNREDGLYATANVLYRRAVFDGLGGFDEGFGTYPWGQPVGGDDTDLAWRVKRAGYASAFAPGAIVYHQATPIGLRSALLGTVAAQVIPGLVKEAPELRRMCLYRRYFLHRAGAAFYPLLLGLLLTWRTRWGLVLGLPWMWANWPVVRPDVWPPTRWWRVAARLVLQFESAAVMALALCYSSARTRTPVL